MFSSAMDSEPYLLTDDLIVPAGRERLGRAHQLRVDIAIALSLAPLWLRRALADRNAAKARGATAEIVERIACAIERRFSVAWHGSNDQSENARAIEEGSPLFGGPDFRNPLEPNLSPRSAHVDSATRREEHIANTESGDANVQPR